MTESIGQQRDVQVGFYNLNIDPLHTVVGGAGTYLDFQRQGEYDVEAGILWSDVRLPPTIRRAGRQLAKLGAISCLEESWREDTIPDVIEHMREGNYREAGRKAAIIASLTPLDVSYHALNNVQRQTGEKLPIIVNPVGDSIYHPPRRPRQTYLPGMFANILYQPTAFWAEWHGIAAGSRDHSAIAEQIIEAQSRQGLDGIALNLNALTMEKGGKHFAHPQEVAVGLAKHESLDMIIVALRPEYGGNRETMEKACAGNLAATPMGETLAAIHQALPIDRRLLLHVKAAAAEVKGTKSSTHTPYTAKHAHITAGIRNIFAVPRSV